MDLEAQAHHDGSPLYLSDTALELGGSAEVAVRVPRKLAVDAISVRVVVDAEPRYVAARRDRADDDAVWWRAELPIDNPVVRYRFLVEGAGAPLWLHAAGTSDIDLTDATDFVVTTALRPPDWLATSIGYQIFPDRFARSGASYAAPPWALPAQWDDAVDPTRGVGVRQWFGGDLGGIEAHLDHLDHLGVDLLYLTPVFPARSNHRYDAATFDTIDPWLGGDAAFASLIDAAHRRRMRVIGDLTTNHTGDHHEWFRRAQADASSVEAGFYLFDEHPHGYHSWSGVPSLPKLDHRSAELRHRLYDGDESAAARWMHPPYGLDGWRVDCANVTARLADVDLNREVARTLRRQMTRTNPDAWLVAEHCYDASSDLTGDGWHGVMAYQWFGRPLWSWLGGGRGYSLMSPRPLPRYDGTQMVRAMRALSSGIPWSAVTASMTMLDSHDTARFRSVVGSRDLHIAGAAMLLTQPGVPTWFAGSEIGVEGTSTDAGRAPFPWSEDRWDHEMLDAARTLNAVRRASPALQRGSLRWLRADADAVTFARELDDECVVVHVARAAHDEVAVGGIPTGQVDALVGDPPRRTADGAHAVARATPGATIWRVAR
jgi:alpha-glucosidase